MTEPVPRDGARVAACPGIMTRGREKAKVLPYVQDAELFQLELRMLEKVREQCRNLHLMIPFVRTLSLRPATGPG